MTNDYYRIVDTLDQISKETGKTVAQVSLNWLLQRPTVVNLIIGARNAEQLTENLAIPTGTNGNFRCSTQRRSYTQPARSIGTQKQKIMLKPGSNGPKSSLRLSSYIKTIRI